jgi:hypothetical protein
MEKIDLLTSFQNFYEKYKNNNNDISLEIKIGDDVSINKKISTINSFTEEQYTTIENNPNYREIFLRDLYISLIKYLSNKNIIIIKNIILYNLTKKIICEYSEFQFSEKCYWGTID